MNCFNHQDITAVCSCGTCAKGLCQNCMQPCSGKFACSKDCAENWDKLAKMNEKALKIYGLDKPGNKPSKMGSRAALFNISLGLLFLGFGIYDFFYGAGSYGLGSYSGLLSAIGLASIVYGYKTYKDGIRL